MSEPDARDQPPSPRADGDILREDWLDRPRADRFDPERQDFGEAMAAHRAAVGAGSPGYRDPQTGLFVMTSQYLRDRGWCCDRGCRHCPYRARIDVSESEQT